MLKAKNFLIAARELLVLFFKACLGAMVGLAVLEGILRVNSGLLFRGMALPAPVDPPLTVREYDVRYSDADAISWRPDLIRPIPPEANYIEAHVRFETDEFGFRNKPPLPPQVDVIVLGLSYSLGAQMAHPWPDLLADQTGWKVLNLSQPGSGIEVKADYLQRYGLPHQPHWVIVEVQPSIDIIGRGDPPSLLIEGLPSPVLRNLILPLSHRTLISTTDVPIYPLHVDIPGRSVNLTCCLHYLDVMTLDRETFIASAKWLSYRQRLLDLVRLARKQSACVALLYAPIKSDMYFPLATNPAQLSPALKDLVPLRLDQDGRLNPDAGMRIDVETLRRNALVGRDVIAEFAGQHGLAFADPSQRFVQAILQGTDPFMVYDSHLNATGHALVAQEVVATLQNQPCR